MLDRLTRINIYTLSRPAAVVIGVATFTLVVAADYLTTYELSLTPFYLFVILLVTWNCGWKWGLGFAFLSFAAPIVIGNLVGYPYSEPIYFYIDNANRLISYLVALGLTSQLNIMHEREKNSARLDYLTGIANQKGFYEAIRVEIARHRRGKSPLSVAYLDCDNFKDVNDRFGHKEGDRLLGTVAQTLRGHLRRTDVIGRLGGDEFAIVLSNTDKDRAINVVDKLRHELNAIMAEHGWPVTFSVGLGIFKNAPESEDEIISFTDKLMYRVKSSGKNNVLTEVFATSGAWLKIPVDTSSDAC
jgi:diguanylate cyclase (GGDEF)-like protein